MHSGIALPFVPLPSPLPVLEDPLLADDDVLLLDEVDDGFVALFAACGSVGDEPSPVALLLLLLL